MKTPLQMFAASPFAPISRREVPAVSVPGIVPTVLVVIATPSR